MEDRRRDFERALTGTGLVPKAREPLFRHTTFGIGGDAMFWIEVANEAELAAVLRATEATGLPWWVFGCGSNVLVSDQGLPGVVFRLGGQFVRVERMTQIAGGEEVLTCGAGVRLDEIAVWAEAAGLAGAEFLAGIPGTVGGGIRSNAGAFGRSLADMVAEVRVMEPDGSIRVMAGSELTRGYRESLVPPGVVVTAARFSFGESERAWSPDSGPQSRRRGAESGMAGGGPGGSGGSEQDRVSVERIRRQRREKQPSEPSAGSFFRNPEAAPAGRLIENCGLKGRRLGGAQVSEKHANFIVNRGGARFADVYELAQAVKANVEEQTGILLEEEVRVLP